MGQRRSQAIHSNALHAILLSTVVLGCADMLPGELARTQGVQVRRTSFGIPHIEAADERGLGFGTGYSFAQDNLCLLAEEMVTVSGERSLNFGAEATYEPSSDGT